MENEPSFDMLIQRVRAGDQEAALLLVRQYESTIRRFARYRLVDRRLDALFDSTDVCQSVLMSFFVRAAAGEFDLENPAQLVGLLARMAQNKVASQARRQHAQRRDYHRQKEGDAPVEQVAAPAGTPSRILMAREMLDEAYRRFSPEELELVKLREEGLSWNEIAARGNDTAQNLRKRHSRALNRVALELGLDVIEEEGP